MDKENSKLRKSLIIPTAGKNFYEELSTEEHIILLESAANAE